MSELASAARPTLLPLPIEVRPARPADRDAVLAFASTTWDGWDYIPGVWDAWLAAADGVLLVACAAEPARGDAGVAIAVGQPVALSRVTMLASGEAWLEGMRVDPAVRGREVATNLQVAELAWAAAQGATAVRYLTGEENEGSHRLGARHGFGRLADRRWYGPPDAARVPGGANAAGEPADSRVRRVASEAPSAVVGRWWRFVAADPTFRAGDELYERRPWAYQRLDAAGFAAHVRRGEVTLADDDRALAILVEAPERPERPPDVALLVGDGESALTLLLALGRERGHLPGLRLPDPQPPILAGDAAARWAAAGLVPREHAAHLLGRRLDEGPLPQADRSGILTLTEPPRPLARPEPI